MAQEYKVRLGTVAEKKFQKLEPDTKLRVLVKLRLLRENPRPSGCLKLEDHDSDGWRIRVGKLRILYEIDDSARLIEVFDIDKRDKVYKERR